MRKWIAVPALALGAAACAGESPTDITDFGPDDPSILIFAKDQFRRQLSGTWGSAEIGGRYFPGGVPLFSVDGQHGVVTLSSGRPERAVLDGAWARDVTGLTRFKIDRMPTTGFHTVQGYARRDRTLGDGLNYYRFRVRAFNNSMDVRIERSVDGRLDFLTDIKNSNVTFAPDQWYWLRWQAVGIEPTVLRMRLWKDGRPEPASWDLETTDRTHRLTSKGTVGVRVEAPSLETQWPVRFYFAELHAERAE